MVRCRHLEAVEQVQFLPLPSKFFENTSHIEDLRMDGSLQFACSGSGPSGSFSIKHFFMGEVKQPIEDISYLRRLVVEGVFEQGLLEDIVVSAPRLTSLIFNNCDVYKTWVDGRGVEGLPSLDVTVDTDTFVNITSGERRAGTKNFTSLIVNGVLEGERLKEFRSLVGNRN
jgi:hypothetical protein